MSEFPRSLRKLCRLHGVELSYEDLWGNERHLDAEAAVTILSALGVDASTEDTRLERLASIRELSWRRFAEPTAVVYWPDRLSLSVTCAEGEELGRVKWSLTLEDGGSEAGTLADLSISAVRRRNIGDRRAVRHRVEFSQELPVGYHTLRFADAGGVAALSDPVRVNVIVAPRSCYLPAELEQGQKLWGVSAQLYGLRSAAGQGVGTYNSIAGIASAIDGAGAACIGLNPLHAKATVTPENCSPYTPSSRRMLNAMFIDSGEPAGDGEPAVTGELVDYPVMWNSKRARLEEQFKEFIAGEGAESEQQRSQFEAFLKDRQFLELSATFEALQEILSSESSECTYWRNWPAEYQRPNSDAIRKFQCENQQRVLFYQYLQWRAHCQLKEAAGAVSGMPIGLYLDLAVGVPDDSIDVWMNSGQYVSGLEVGAPPDGYSLKGQRWGFVPFHPRALRESGYEELKLLFRSNMEHAGALRIDHAMSLMRLFCIPNELPASRGAYLRYRFTEIAAVLAIESARNNCMIIGEDLGTVPKSFRPYMEQYCMYSYRVLLFMQHDGEFLPSESYPAQSLVTPTTHDHPPIWMWWSGADIELRASLGLLDNNEDTSGAHTERERERNALRQRLAEEGLEVPDDSESLSYEGYLSALRFLSSSPSQLAVVSLEDVFQSQKPVNIPGVTDAYPCWRQRLAEPVSAFSTDTRLRQVAEAFASRSYKSRAS